MKQSHQSEVFAFSIIAAAILSACGGSGGGGESTAADTNAYVQGTAAYGAAMAKASITVTDKAGKTVTVISDENGDYKATVTGFAAPLLVTATGASGDSVRVYHAIFNGVLTAGSTSRANVTPLTEAIVAMASSDGKSPEEFVDSAKFAALDSAKLGKAVAALNAIIRDVASDLGAVGFDPLSSTFKADRSSAGDRLLDIIKVAVSNAGVSLRNIAIPIASTDSGASTAAEVTITDVKTQVAIALPKPVITDSATLVDVWVAQINKCLALPQASRVSVDAAGTPIAFLGDCDKVTNFTASYKRNGYTLLQYWGRQLAAVIPDGAVLGAPEMLGFLKGPTGDDYAVLRLPYSSPKGAGAYFETAHKIAGTWMIEGNQRNYDASMSFRVIRQTDQSTNHFVPGRGPDLGKDVGNFSAYHTRLAVSFNQSGPNGANVYAVRVKGPGLPAAGLVLARSSVCGTSDYLAFYRNDGGLPAAPAVGSVYPLVTASANNSYYLGVKAYGNAYTGSDFYNEYRGRNADGTASTSPSSNIAPVAVDVSTIPDLAAYSFEVFKAGSAVVADTFVARNVARPFAVETAAKLPWATPSADSLKYADPTGPFSGELTSAALSWTVAAGAPPITSAYLFGTGNDTATPPVFRRMNMGQNVKALGDTSLTVLAGAEFDGNGNACTYAKVPAFTSTSGSREVGLRMSRIDGVGMQQYVFHSGRPVVVK